MGTVLSTATIGITGTKAASIPRRRYGWLRRLRCVTTVEEANLEVVERWGCFQRVARPGLGCVWCCLGETVAGRLSTSLQHQEVQFAGKTRDGVWVEMVLSVQYRVAEEGAYAAFYSLEDPVGQVTSYVLDAVGMAVAGLEVEGLFEQREGMVAQVQRGLGSVLRGYGYELEACLVTVLTPTETVRDAMSAVKAAQRQREAAWEQGEADKFRAVKHAEASSESKYLQGQGMARFLIAFAAGARDAMRVMVTGRIKQEDLAFPEAPPANEAAALAAAAAPPHPPHAHAEDGAQQGRSHAQEEEQQQQPHLPQHHHQHRKAPPGLAGGNGGLGRPLLQPAAGPGPGHAAKPSDAAVVARIGEPALLPPQAPASPSRAGGARGHKKAVAAERLP